VLAQPRQMTKVAKERASLEALIQAASELKGVEKQIAGNEELTRAGDPEMAALANVELPDLTARRDALAEKVHLLLLPKDPNDDKNVVLEIRAGTGGEEAALFAGEIFRMYQKYAEKNRWKLEILSSSPAEMGGMKEVIAEIAGDGAYARLKWESGVHRVQRVPATEAQGRIHTSAATVAVLPEAEEVDVKIEDKDIRIDVFRASGPGGQSVNTTDSAVRITHLASGLVVSQQDQKSQLQNKLKAMEVLRARLLDLRVAQQEAERARMRRTQVGTGDRSAKIRTYNFPQSRVTDHRIGWTTHDLQGFMDGEIAPVVEALKLAEVEEQLGGDGDGTHS